MNHAERFKAVMNFQSVDRLPYIEWAMWWDKTIERWKTEGLPDSFKGANHVIKTESVIEIGKYLGLDPYCQFWISPLHEPADIDDDGLVIGNTEGAEASIKNFDDYNALKPRIFPGYDSAIESMRPWGQAQKNGDALVWITLEGFFWFPRTLFGIEPHMYAFYDHPELMHQMNQDLVDHHISILRKMEKVCIPTFMTFAEDMSYNHGPMLSKKLFDEFLAPYYRQVVPVLEELDIIPIVDTDGDLTAMVSWLQEVGIRGALPLERQAGTDAAKTRAEFPDFCIIGHFNKLVMADGEEAMRAEFERLLPVMKTGGFIPSVDHQTPPNVSLQQYYSYLRLLAEYCEKAAKA